MNPSLNGLVPCVFNVRAYRWWLEVPAVDLAETVVGIGNCSGADIDKFEAFDLTPTQADKVNAPLIATDRGIKVLEAKEPRARDYLNVITVKASAEGDKSGRVAGTVFGRHPRFVEVNGFRLDALPEGDVIFEFHRFENIE